MNALRINHDNYAVNFFSLSIVVVSCNGLMSRFGLLPAALLFLCCVSIVL